MTYKDRRGYTREHSNAVHRHRAYHHIYKPNKDKYPLPFEAYEVHHKDFNKNNNRLDNLAVLTPEEHDREHHCMEALGLTAEEYQELAMELMEKFDVDEAEILELFADAWEVIFNASYSSERLNEIIEGFKKNPFEWIDTYRALKETCWEKVVKKLEKKERKEKRKKKVKGMVDRILKKKNKEEDDEEYDY